MSDQFSLYSENLKNQAVTPASRYELDITSTVSSTPQNYFPQGKALVKGGTASADLWIWWRIHK